MKDKNSVQYLLKGELSDRKKSNKKLRKFVNYGLLIFAAAVLGYAFNTFFFRTVFMSGPSMESTISNGDELILNRAAYLVSDVEQYDIVAIQKIGGEDYYDIKRVIALPGDTVSVVGGVLVVNGKQVDESLPSYAIDQLGRLNSVVKLGSDEYFVLGDNTENSEDSRFVNFGNVLKSEIKGKIIYRLGPADKRGKVY